MHKAKKRWSIKRAVWSKTTGRARWMYVRVNGEIILFYDRNAAELARIKIATSCAFGLDDVTVVRR